MKRQAEAPSALIHGRSTIAAVFAIALVALLALVPAASATKYVDRLVAGGESSGTAQGQFNSPRGVAINDPNVADGSTDPLGASTDGYIYVADRTNRRIQVFGADDSFKFTFGRGVKTGGDGAEVCDSSEVPCTATVADDEEGEFSNPASVAVNQANGDVYVRDSSNTRIQQFKADGTFVRAWGWDVDTAGGTGFEICTSACKIGLSGGNGGQLAQSPIATGIAVDPAAPHHVFVADGVNRRIQEFEPDGDFVRLWGGDVVVEGQPGDLGSSFEICASTSPGVCKVALSLGNFVPFTNGLFGGSPSPLDIAIDGASGIVYAADARTTRDPNIMRFDSDESTPAGLLLPGIMLALAGISPGTGSQSESLVLDPASGNLFAPITSVEGIIELASPGTSPVQVDTHLANSGLSVVALASKPGSGDLYLISESRLLAADDDGAPPAESFTRPVKDIEAHSATFSGCVDPLGTSVLTASYRFQYSVDGVKWTDAAAAKGVGSAAIDCGNPANEVSAPVTGLLANTEYRVRMVTNRQFANPDAPSVTETSFVTDALAPEVVTMPPSIRTDSSAVLAGTINPHGAETTYRFEWGKATAYGKEIPVFPGASAGSGGSTDAHSQLIEGLSPSTTYHYRLCAQSVKGSACGADQAFTTRSAFAGFAKRGYEQVTPLGPFNPQSVLLTVKEYGGTYPASVDGNTIVYGGWGLEAHLPDSPIGDPAQPSGPMAVVGRRSDEGWQAKVPHPRPFEFASNPPAVPFMETTTDRVVLSTRQGWQAYPEPKAGTYLHDYTSTDLPQLLYSPGIDLSGTPTAATADLSHLVVESASRLIPALGPDNTVQKVYEWDEGELKLVSVNESNVPFTGASQIGGPAGPGGGLTALTAYGDLDAISGDGRHIFFSTPVGLASMKIYRRSDSETTKLVSPSKRTPVDSLGQKAKTYERASADGDVVFFTSAEQLTDDANTGPTRSGKDLYRYEISTDTLIDVSAESNTTDGARVIRVIGSSESGDRVYYAALGKPIAGQGIEGKRNIYVWHADGTADGETKFVTTLGDGILDSASLFMAADLGHANTRHPILGSAFTARSRVAEDGETLIFGSAEPLTGQPTRGHAQVYVYEAEVEGGSLSCVSCRPDGSPSNGRALVSVPTERTLGEAGSSFALDGRDAASISTDGKRIFFHSTDTLLPSDVNEAADVYLWEEGRLSLLSSGTSERDSYFVGTSSNGNDAFIVTGSKLVGQDYGDGYDIYDVRVGGGLPSQNQPPAGEPCQADECKPATESPPAQQAPQSTSQTDDNYVFPLEVISPNAKARSRAAKQGKLAIGVIANQMGRITVRAINGKKVMGNGSKTVFKTGPTSVLLKLKPLAKQALEDKGRLSLEVEVTLAGESETVDVDLRRAK